MRTAPTRTTATDPSTHLACGCQGCLARKALAPTRYADPSPETYRHHPATRYAQAALAVGLAALALASYSAGAVYALGQLAAWG